MAAMALAAILPACGGGGGGNSPTTTPPAPQPTRTLIGNVSFQVLGVPDANRLGLTRDTGLAALTINESGTLEVIADWTFASNDVDIQLFRGSCTQQLLTTVGCTLITQTTSVTLKPERLTTSITAGTYTLGFTNYGNTSESGVGQVFLTR
jgi:hypothetical protein